MDFPSGAHSNIRISSFDRVSCKPSPPSISIRKISETPVLFDKYARVLLSGDHFGLLSDFGEFVNCLNFFVLMSSIHRCVICESTGADAGETATTAREPSGDRSGTPILYLVKACGIVRVSLVAGPAPHPVQAASNIGKTSSSLCIC